MPLSVMYDIYRTRKNRKNENQRLALGRSGDRILFVIGLNPSTATNIRPDSTITRIDKVAKINRFDGFVMLNLCSLRSTYINLLPLKISTTILRYNEQEIVNLILANSKPSLWLAWGENIITKEYFSESLIRCYEALKDQKIIWLNFGPLTKNGHPRHPSRLNYGWNFTDFDIDGYIRSKVWMPRRFKPNSNTFAVSKQRASRDPLAGSSALRTGT
jgi:hypothetical protein